MEYHKIQTVFNRVPQTNFKTVIEGDWARPEFEYLQNIMWDFTEKVDGTNIRAILTPQGVEFRGKTNNAQMPPFLLTKLNALFSMFPACYDAAFPDAPEVIIYGEGYGARIQKGGGNYIPDGVSFVVFDIKIGDYWLMWDDVVAITKSLCLECVPLFSRGTIHDGVSLVKSGFKSAWGNFPMEGIVARPQVQLFNRQGQRVIWKLKCKDFTARPADVGKPAEGLTDTLICDEGIKGNGEKV